MPLETPGIAASDAICVTRAAAANLLDPQSFVVLLSDSNENAHCRLYGFGGKNSANCGQATLPKVTLVSGPARMRKRGSDLLPVL